MNKTIYLCVISAVAGAFLAAVWHQIPSHDAASAQEPVLRQPAGQLPPAVSSRRPPAVMDARQSSSVGSGLEEFAPEERTNILVYEKANRSVVHIKTNSAQRELLFLEVPTEGAGSGSILDKQGHVLTNYHVVEGAQEIHVTLHSGETYTAGVVGFDPPNDMAVVKIKAPAEDLVPMQLGDSSRLRVGQIVYAIGNPFGLERTMTTGIISSLDRSLKTRAGGMMQSFIQIDAALNRGNSGGPLLDTRGRLIGMNTAIASSTGENTGVGFAIPVDAIRRVVPQLIEKGKVIRPEAGISRVYQTEQGLLIVTLAPGGPAERAGLRGFRVVRETKRRGPFTYEEKKVDRSQADLIVAVDGEKVTTGDAYLAIIERHQPGERAMITVARDGQLIDVPVTLGSND